MQNRSSQDGITLHSLFRKIQSTADFSSKIIDVKTKEVLCQNKQIFATEVIIQIINLLFCTVQKLFSQIHHCTKT